MQNFYRGFIAFFLIISVSCCHKKAAESGSFSYSSDVWIGEGFSGFDDYKVSTAKKFMISASEKLATEAGKLMLKKGGNAVDAAIAAQMVLNVVEPQSSGIGGGVFILYYDSKSKKTIYFNGRETAPELAKSDIFLDKKTGKPREFIDVVGGGLSVATPGALKALKAAHEKYGKLSWGELFEPAIKIAENGFVLSEKIYAILKSQPHLTRFGSMKIYYDEFGQPKKVGEIIKNLELAKTFRTIAKEGIEPFYRGKIAQNIVSAVRNSPINPGLLSLSDLKNYHIKTGDLLCRNYRIKYKICSMPLPSSGGVTLLQTLGILENFEIAKMKPLSIESVHLISEATKLAYADRNEYVADSADVPISKMLDSNYLKQRAALINMDRALENVAPGNFSSKKNRANNVNEKPSTTHLSIVDADGNAVSMTSSIEYFFGSVLMVDGFVLNNQLTDFSLAPKINGKDVANRLMPGKQPRSSMTPVLVFDKNDNLLMVVGSPGGPRIIQYVLKAVIAYLDWGYDIQQAISLPNHIALNNVIELEDRTSLSELKPELEKLGHKVVVTDITSGIHGVVIGKNYISGGADPRRHGSADGE